MTTNMHAEIYTEQLDAVHVLRVGRASLDRDIWRCTIAF